MGEHAEYVSVVDRNDAVAVRLHEPLVQAGLALHAPDRLRACDIQVLGKHESVEVTERAVNVEVAGVPATLRHVDPAPEFEASRHRLTGTDVDRFLRGDIFLAALDAYRRLAGGQLNRERVPRRREMTSRVPDPRMENRTLVGQAVRGEIEAVIATPGVHTGRNPFPRFRVGDRGGERPVSFGRLFSVIVSPRTGRE